MSNEFYSISANGALRYSPYTEESIGTNSNNSSRKVSNAMVVRPTGKVWHPPGHLNHVETKQP